MGEIPLSNLRSRNEMKTLTATAASHFDITAARWDVKALPTVLTKCVCVWLCVCSLSRHRYTGSWWEDGPDALVVVAVCEQRPLLRVAKSGASDQVALTPLCILTRGVFQSWVTWRDKTFSLMCVYLRILAGRYFGLWQQFNFKISCFRYMIRNSSVTWGFLQRE